jgi:hypothetical protein
MILSWAIEFGNATLEFGESAIALASIEVNKPVAQHFQVLGEIQRNIKALHEKQVFFKSQKLELHQQEDLPSSINFAG